MGGAVGVALALAVGPFGIGEAQAAEGSVAIGVEATWNDPFVRTIGGRLTAGVTPLPWLRAGVTGSFYPLKGEAAWRPMTTSLKSQYNVGPEISYMVGRGMGEVAWLPVRAAAGALQETLGFTVGMGGVLTQDDPELLLLQYDDPDFAPHAREWHPTVLLGVVGEIRGDQWGVRLRLDRMRYVEIVMEDVQEEKSPMWIGAEYAWYPGAR